MGAKFRCNCECMWGTTVIENMIWPSNIWKIAKGGKPSLRIEDRVCILESICLPTMPETNHHPETVV